MRLSGHPFYRPLHMSILQPKPYPRTNQIVIAVAGLLMVLSSGYDLAGDNADVLKNAGYLIAGMSLVVAMWAQDREGKTLYAGASVVALVGGVLSLVGVVL